MNNTNMLILDENLHITNELGFHIASLMFDGDVDLFYLKWHKHVSSEGEVFPTVEEIFESQQILFDWNSHLERGVVL